MHYVAKLVDGPQGARKGSKSHKDLENLFCKDTGETKPVKSIKVEDPLAVDDHEDEASDDDEDTDEKAPVTGTGKGKKGRKISRFFSC